ncbi:MAG: hypothetical protein E7426_08670 [Ruminococcaceae bacterium]|jgi:hypothetical protein|nr:hypothetical protein [Oscillospiraceae bacterium]
MMYCEKCRVLVSDGVCPICSDSTLRVPLADDFCFLAEKEALWSALLADVLTQNEIPFVQENVLGAGFALKVGPMWERVRFYVPYGRLEEARGLVDELFSGEIPAE